MRYLQRYKLLIAGITLAMSTLLLSSCFPTGEVQVNPDDLIQPGTEVPSKIYEEISESLIVNADVEFDSSVIWREVGASYQLFDNTLALDLLAADKAILSTYEKSGGGGLPDSPPSFYYEFADKSSLALSPGGVLFRTEFSEKAYYDDVLFPDGRMLRSNILDVYTKTTLESINREEAIDIVKQAVESLGIEVDPDPLVVALDHETLMNEWEPFALKDGTQAPPWTKDQEAYVVCYKPKTRGLPCSENGYVLTDNSTMSNGTILYGIVSREGLVTFVAQGIFAADSTESQATELIKPEVAIEVMSAKYADLISGMPVEINTIKCELVPMFENTSLEHASLKPMWVIDASQDIDDPEIDGATYKYSFTLFVDAQTGALQRFVSL